jgi:hypothetical protein
MRCCITVFLLLLSACGHRAAPDRERMRRPGDAPLAPQVTRLDLMSVAPTLNRESLLRLLAPLEGKQVEVVGCAVSMSPTREWKRGFLVYPIQYCPNLFTGQYPTIGPLPPTRIIAVRLGADQVPVPEEARPKPLVRVRGRLRLGDVRYGTLVEAWADIEDARVEVLQTWSGK